MPRPDFANAPLGNTVAVGAVNTTRARIWFRVDDPGRYRLELRRRDSDHVVLETELEVARGNEQDNTLAVTVPPSGQAPLEPSTTYRFAIERMAGGQGVGEGTFETAPDNADEMPDRFCLGFVSCNQPFCEDGTLNENSLAMLRAARKALERHDCRALFWMGDQMYADVPRNMSLFDDKYFAQLAPAGRRGILDCSPAEVRKLYHRRYRHFFAAPEWQQLQTQFPCYPILDDHDIIDNWGSVPEHSEARWQSLWQGARLAYCDYQGSRVLEHPAARTHFGYQVVLGRIATCVLDLRSARGRNGGSLLAEEQFSEVQAFLDEHRDKAALFLVLSVPAVHLPRWASRLASRVLRGVEDFSDRWSAPEHIRDRDRLLTMLHDHQQQNPGQPIVLLSGDIHIGCAHTIAWHDGTEPLHQVTSSAITHGRSQIEGTAAKISIQMNRKLKISDGQLTARVRKWPAESGSSTNPYRDLNLGIVEITPRGDSTEIRSMLYGHRGDEPVCVYKSRPVYGGDAAEDAGHGRPAVASSELRVES